MNTKEKQNQALDLFTGSLNCAQSVMAVFAGELKFEKESLEKLGAAFGGGMGEGETCGAVTGALMVLGLKYGNSSTSPELKESMKEISGRFKIKFLEKHKSLKCLNLTGYNLKIEKENASADKAGVFQSRCPHFIADAIAIVDEIESEINQI